jgi:TolB-like protein/DNA-binding winged helix-turn-helix (wHTH) protein/Flp pilus assembly protein TadD
MQAQVSDHFVFNGYKLDLRTRTLSYLEQIIPLRPKSFDVLAYLVLNAGTLVAKDEIIEAVWPSVIASDESLSRCISDVRTALDDKTKQVIRTVPGRGYQFAAEVTAPSIVHEPGARENVANRRLSRNWYALIVPPMLMVAMIAIIWFAASRDGSQAPTNRASIAVVPFRNNSGDTKIDPFVAGLTTDLNSALARIPEMLVISESSTRQYKNKTIDVRQVAKEMGVDHVLTGTVQGSDDRVRISVQLSEGKNGSAIWSQRYDRDIAYFLQLQDDIVRNVLIGLQIRLTHGETARDLSRGTNNLEAWLLNVEAIAEGFKFKQEKNLIARDLFLAASKIDPDWAPPISGIAWTYREAVRRGWSNDAAADRDKWFQLAEKCAQMDVEFFGCYIQLGNYYIENNRIEEGIALREKALQLAPNDLSALSGLAWQLVLVGQVKRGLELLQRAKLVSPIHPPWLIATEAYALQMDGQYDKAIEGFQYALALGNFPDWHARLAAVYAEIGDLENARNQSRLFIDKRPNRKISDLTRILRIQNPERTKHYAGLLKKAGIPD